MNNKNNIIDELFSLDARQLASWKDQLPEEQVDKSYLEDNRSLLLSLVALPTEKLQVDKKYLVDSKADILGRIEEKPKASSLLKWLRPVAVAASVLFLLGIAQTLLTNDSMTTADFSSIETDEIIDYLDDELNYLDTEELYSLVDTETELELELELDIDIPEGDVIDMIYNELSLETIEYYY